MRQGSDRIHIVLITTSFPRATDGSEAAGSFVADFCGALAGLCRVTVVAPGDANGIEQGSSYPIFRYRAPQRALSQLRLVSPVDALAALRVLRNGAAATRNAVAAGDVDYLFALWALPCGYWARKAAQMAGVRYGLWCLGSDIWSLAQLPVVGRVLRTILRRADRVYADGHALGRQVTQISGVTCGFLPSSRQLVLPAPIPARSAPPYRLLYIGRWHTNKGTDLLLDALELLSDAQWQRIECVRIFGGGPLQTQVQRRVQLLMAAGRPVQCHGYIDKQRAGTELMHSDWLLIPSRIESIPVVFSDALQACRPVISMPVGDLPELIGRHGVGICAKQLTAPAFAVAIDRALACAPVDFAARIASAAREFDIALAAQTLLRAVSGAATPPSPPR